MNQGFQLVQTIGLHLAPHMTPVLRRSREQRPVDDSEDDTPWHVPSPR